MIDKYFWAKVAANWSLEDDGIEIPDNVEQEAAKVKDIQPEDIPLFDDVDEEYGDIFADLGLDDL